MTLISIRVIGANWSLVSRIMLDIKFIRENKELVAAGARKKRLDFDVDELLAADDDRRALLTAIEKKKAEQNRVSKEIAVLPEGERSALIEEMKKLKESLSIQEEKLKEVLKRWQLFMLRVPNIPDVSVPEGGSDADNQEIKRWGEPKKFSFKPRNHIELMEGLGMVDFEAGAKVSGFRGYFLKGEAVKLTMALWQYAYDFFTRQGEFLSMLAPALVRKETLLGAGYLPQGEEDLYKTQEGYLSGTAEVPVMSYFASAVVDHERLPLKIFAFSPCYRREAGSYGRDEKGLFRVHEFYKFEQVVLCEASHEQSVKFHEWLNRNTERFLESLGLPMRTVVNCGGDLGLGQVKKYDIELYLPSEGRYREIGSASYFHDFQTRRLNIRYRDADGALRFAHSLNATAMPSPRLLIALVENFQLSDGSVAIPDVLQPYFGRKSIKKLK